jgi:hypothetical protein
MNPAIQFRHLANGSHATPDLRQEKDPTAYFPHIAIAIIAFIAGMILGHLFGPEPSGSGASFHPSVPVQPHPRSLLP